MINHALPRMREQEKERGERERWGDGETERGREKKKIPFTFGALRIGVGGERSKGTDKEMRESTSPRLHLAPEEREENDFNAAALMKESVREAAAAAALFPALR